MQSKLHCYIIGNICRHLKDKIDAKSMHMATESMVASRGQTQILPLELSRRRPNWTNNNFMFFTYMTNFGTSCGVHYPHRMLTYGHKQYIKM